MLCPDEQLRCSMAADMLIFLLCLHARAYLEASDEMLKKLILICIRDRIQICLCLGSGLGGGGKHDFLNTRRDLPSNALPPPSRQMRNTTLRASIDCLLG